MNERIKESASVHFQLLIAGTVLFLAVFFWFAIPRAPGDPMEWCIIYGLSAIAGYLAFVVLVAGHALPVKRRD